MADLEDLGYQSISDMSNDEGIELLRQIRLSRRIPVKKVSVAREKKKSDALKTSNVSSDVAAELLKILGGSNG